MQYRSRFFSFGRHLEKEGGGAEVDEIVLNLREITADLSRARGKRAEITSDIRKKGTPG